MHVLFITTSYPSTHDDWKGRFMLDMLHALAETSDLKLSYWGPSGPLPPTAHNICTESESIWLDKLLESGGIAAKLRAKPLASLFTVAKLFIFLNKAYRRIPDVDMFHINWLQNAIPLLFTRKPALITALGTDLSLLNNQLVAFAFNLAVLRRKTIIAPNSDWMIQPLRHKTNNQTRIHPVYFGVDKKWLEMRRNNADQDTNKWLVILRITERKLGHLFDWAKHLNDQGDELHLFGPLQETLNIPEWVHYHGPCHPKQLLDDWFPDAAGVITLSQHDEGRPQIILDAMAAGIPVIASDLAAHNDLIINKQTGYIVASESQFIAAYYHLSKADTNKQIGDNARNWVKDTIGDWHECSERYVTLYKQLLATQ